MAEPDGSGGVRFLWGPVKAAVAVPRATCDAPAGTATQNSNWDAAAMVGQLVRRKHRRRFEAMIGGEFSFITGIDEDLKARTRHVPRFQTRADEKEAFGRLRLEHLRVAKRKEVNSAELTEAQEKELKQAVDIEVARRTEAFESRVKHQFEQVNEKLKNENHEPQKELDPDRYDAIFNKLFAEPVGDLPRRAADDVKAHADQAVTKPRRSRPRRRARKQASAHRRHWWRADRMSAPAVQDRRRKAGDRLVGRVEGRVHDRPRPLEAGEFGTR